MSISKIAVYQGGQWITEDIAVAASAISGSISSSQISSSGTLSNTIHLGNNQTQHVLVAGIDVNGNLAYPANEIQLSYLYDLTGKIQPQIDAKATTQALSTSVSNLQTALQTSATYVGSNDGNNNLSFKPFNQWYTIPLKHASSTTKTETTRINFQMKKDDNYQVGGLYYVQRGVHFEMGSLILSGSHTSNPSSGTQTSDSVLSTYALCNDLSDSISLHNVAGETSAQLDYARLSMRVAITGTLSASFGFMPFFARHINGDILAISYS